MTGATSTPEYILPNNATEWERLDLQHRLLLGILGDLHRAPLDPSKVKRVLDIGCGTGQWAIDFAKKFPEAQVIGFDIVDKPTWKTGPENCSFRVANLELHETWQDLGDFDFVHSRFISPSVKDWPTMLSRCHAHLNKGGFIEVQEFQFPVQCLERDVDPPNSKVLMWGVYGRNAYRRAGLEPDELQYITEQLKGFGLQDITLEDHFKSWLGPWPEDAKEKELGLMSQKNFSGGMKGFVETLFVKYLKWSPEEVDKWVEECVEEMLHPTLRTWLPLWVCYARKAD